MKHQKTISQAELDSLIDGLQSADRKRVQKYVEFMRLGQADLKMIAARRMRQFLAISRAGILTSAATQAKDKAQKS